MIKDRIVEQYIQIREKWLEANYLHRNLQVVIRMKTSTYAQMVMECCKDRDIYMPEFYDSEFPNIQFTRLCGVKTPIVLDDKLPEEVECTIQLRADYERLEKEKLYERFIKMFDE